MVNITYEYRGEGAKQLSLNRAGTLVIVRLEGSASVAPLFLS